MRWLTIQEISLNGSVIGYVEEAKDVLKYLPSGSPERFKMLGGIDRELLYGEDLYVIKSTDKKKGLGEGDICGLCSIGTLQNQGGCYVCNVCSAALKCGL